MKTQVSKDFRIAFSNAFRLRVGDNDCAITFVVETSAPDGEPYQLDEAEIAMTPRSLKMLSISLAHAVTHLENLLGPIHIHPEKMKALDVGAIPEKPKS